MTMFSLPSLVSALALFGLVNGQLSLQVQTPQGENAVETCELVTFTWSGGSGPYELSVLLNITDPTDPSYGIEKTAVLDYTNRTCSYWNVNVKAGTMIWFTMSDHFRGVAESPIYTVLKGTDTSCVGTDDIAVPADYSCNLAAGSSTNVIRPPSGLSSGAKVGIIVGSILGVLAIVSIGVVSLHYYNRRKRSQQSKSLNVKMEDFGYGQFAAPDPARVAAQQGGIQRPRVSHVRQSSLNVLPEAVGGR